MSLHVTRVVRVGVSARAPVCVDVGAALVDHRVAQLFYQLQDRDLTDDFRVADRLKKVAVPEVLLNLIVVVIRAVFRRLLVDGAYLVGVNLALVALEVLDVLLEELNLLIANLLVAEVFTHTFIFIITHSKI